jgi:hypothetical protein
MAVAMMVAEDMFEAAYKAFFGTGDENLSSALSSPARETVFAKEIPTEAVAPVEASIAAPVVALPAARKKGTLVHA